MLFDAKLAKPFALSPASRDPVVRAASTVSRLKRFPSIVCAVKHRLMRSTGASVAFVMAMSNDEVGDRPCLGHCANGPVDCVDADALVDIGKGRKGGGSHDEQAGKSGPFHGFLAGMQSC